MDKKTEEEKAEETRKEYAREQWIEDVQKLLLLAPGRRIIRYMLGPQCGNLLGMNTDGRMAAVALVDELMKAEPNTLHILFAKQPEDENGWTRGNTNTR